MEATQELLVDFMYLVNGCVSDGHNIFIRYKWYYHSQKTFSWKRTWIFVDACLWSVGCSSIANRFLSFRKTPSSKLYYSNCINHSNNLQILWHNLNVCFSILNFQLRVSHEEAVRSFTTPSVIRGGMYFFMSLSLRPFVIARYTYWWSFGMFQVHLWFVMYLLTLLTGCFLY